MPDENVQEDNHRRPWVEHPASGITAVIGFLSGLLVGQCLYEPNLVQQKNLNDDKIPDLVIETIGGAEHRFYGRYHGVYRNIEQQREENADLYSQK